MMTPSGRRSTAISRSSHSILRKGGLVSTTAAFPLILRLQNPFRLVFWSFADPCRYRLICTGVERIVPGSSTAALRADPLAHSGHPLQGERGRKLPRRHADRAVEPDGLAVQHRVLHDVHRKVAISDTNEQPRWMRNPGAPALPRAL